LWLKYKLLGFFVVFGRFKVSFFLARAIYRFISMPNFAFYEEKDQYNYLEQLFG